MGSIFVPTWIKLMSKLHDKSMFQHELARELDTMDACVRMVINELCSIGYVSSYRKGRRVFYVLSRKGEPIAKACNDIYDKRKI